MDVPGISRPALVAMIVVAVGLFAVGATSAASWLTHSTRVTTRTLPAASTLDIQARVGDVKVVGSNRSDIQLTTKERRSVLGRTEVHVEYRDGKLRIDEKCKGVPGVRDNTCSAGYTLLVPRDIAVDLVTHAGDVHAENLRGDADLETSAGDVHVERVDGRVRLRTVSGDVHADSASASIDASTTSGDVSVFAPNATDVRARTTSGDVRVMVPDRTYAVDADTNSGDENVTVRKDDDAPRHIVATTISGDVHVSPDA